MTVKTVKKTATKVQRAGLRANKALGLFERAHRELEIASGIYQDAIAEHDDAIQQHQLEQRNAQAKLASNNKVLAKLAEFVPNA